MCPCEFGESIVFFKLGAHLFLDGQFSQECRVNDRKHKQIQNSGDGHVNSDGKEGWRKGRTISRGAVRGKKGQGLTAGF